MSGGCSSARDNIRVEKEPRRYPATSAGNKKPQLVHSDRYGKSSLSASTFHQELRSTVASIVQHPDGQRMSYTLTAAAAATGLNKTTILRAIKNGKISGTKGERGEWHIDPAELHRVYPPIAERSDGGDAAQPYAAPDVAALLAQIEALIRQAGERLRQQLDDVRRKHEAARD